jgi:hypothetical protein
VGQNQIQKKGASASGGSPVSSKKSFSYKEKSLNRVGFDSANLARLVQIVKDKSPAKVKSPTRSSSMSM